MVITGQEYLERILEKTDKYAALIQTETGIGIGKTNIKKMLQLPAQLVKTVNIPKRNRLDYFLAPIILGPFF